ncbi:MAG: phage protease [Bacteroidota bacterium]
MADKIQKNEIFYFPTLDFHREGDFIQLLPHGWVKSEQGQVLVDDFSMAEINSFFEKQFGINIDYLNQSLVNPTASSAGRIRKLDSRGQNGLWGELYLSPDAQKEIDSNSYRYISPVVIVRFSDNRAVGIHSIGLTKEPVNYGLESILRHAGINPNAAIETQANSLRELGNEKSNSDSELQRRVNNSLGITDELYQKYGK